MSVQLGPVNSLITLTPNWNFEQALTFVSRQDQRTKTGDLYTYIETGRFRRFTIPWSYVNSSQRTLVNSWWETGLDLFLTVDVNSYAVRIMGNEEPFQSFVRPYGPDGISGTVLYDGEIVVETL